MKRPSVLAIAFATVLCAIVIVVAVFYIPDSNPYKTMESPSNSDTENVDHIPDKSLSHEPVLAGHLLAENGTAYAIIQDTLSNGTSVKHLEFLGEGVTVKDYGNVIDVVYYKGTSRGLDFETIAMKVISEYSAKGYLIVDRKDLGRTYITYFGSFYVEQIILQKVTQQVTLENTTGIE